MPKRGTAPRTPSSNGNAFARSVPMAMSHCLDVKTGAVIWEKTLGWNMKPTKCPYAFTSNRGTSADSIYRSQARRVCSPWKSRTARKFGNRSTTRFPTVLPSRSPSLATRVNRLERQIHHLARPCRRTHLLAEPMTTSNNDSIATPVFQGNRLPVSGSMLELKADPLAANFLWLKSRPTKRILSNTSPRSCKANTSIAQGPQATGCLEASTGQHSGAPTLSPRRKTAPASTSPRKAAAHFLFTDEGNLIRAELSPLGYREKKCAPID